MVATEILSKDQHAKVLAIYSARALNSQQKTRWERTGFNIGQIDGSITNSLHRIEILKTSRIVVMTPDVMHAFLLGKFYKTELHQAISEFIRNVELCVIDEIHLYRGVFGTNSAYLFRRFNNIRRNLRKDLSFPLYITASATLPNPAQHSADITGACNFINIGIEDDGSPCSKMNYFYIKPDKNELKGFNSIAKMQMLISKIDEAKSITFVESRQRTGEIVLATGDKVTLDLEENQIYPYRAGMEEEARCRILESMNSGNFKGIVSTSALEIGIDVKDLNVAILANLPYDLNSYYQRIGRVGRGSCSDSYIIIIDDGSFKSHLLFGDADFCIEKVLPNLEPALYLDSKNIQYVHAGCHADYDKECCELNACLGDVNDSYMQQYFPNEFCSICREVANHQAPKEYDKYADIENPHLECSLRNNGDNYTFVNTKGEVLAGESVNRQQLFREAYKGAIRNITHQSPFGIVLHNQEVVRIDKYEKVIVVKNINDNKSITKPIKQVYVYPNFNCDRRIKTVICGACSFYNLELYEKVIISGYKKIFFQQTEKIMYPSKHIDTLRTTGVIMFHPVLNNIGVHCGQIGELIFETFLMRNAFDRNDINHKPGKLYVKVNTENLNYGAHFVALYDVNQLNITSNLMNEEILKDTFRYLSKYLDSLASSILEDKLNKETKDAILEICNCVLLNGFKEKTTKENPLEFMTVYAQQSPAKINLYPMDDNSKESDWKDCIVLTAQKDTIPDTVTYIVMCDGNLSYNVTSEMLKPSFDSVMTSFNYVEGIYIK